MVVFLDYAFKINGQEFPNETPALNTSIPNKIKLLLSILLNIFEF